MISTCVLLKSATTNQIYSNSASNLKLKSLPLGFSKTGKLDLWLLRSTHSNSASCFLGHPVLLLQLALELKLQSTLFRKIRRKTTKILSLDTHFTLSKMHL